MIYLKLIIYFLFIKDKSKNFFYYHQYINPKHKIEHLRNEIINNVPNIYTNKNDLFIYIRSGDILEFS